MSTIITWQHLILLGLAALTIAGLWLMLNGSRGKDQRVVWSEFRVHLGTALLISAITIALVDLHLQREIESTVAAIPDGVLRYVCHNDRGLERAVNKQIIENEIRYSNFVISATLDAKPDSNPPHAQYNWANEYNVVNVGDTPLPWTFEAAVSSDLDADSQVAIDKTLSVKEEGNETNLITPQDVPKGNKSNNSGTAAIKKDIILKPKVPYYVQVHYFIHDRLEIGVGEHRVRTIVSGVKYYLQANPNLFEIEIHPNYPGREIEKLSSNEKKQGLAPFTTYEIRETLLPFQGFTVWWKFKHP